MNKLPKNIAIWGDSLLQGVILDEKLGKYSILENNCATSIANKVGINIYNHSRFGCTVPKGLKSLTKTLESDVEFSAAIIEFGGNDCDFNWQEIAQSPETKHDPKTPLSAFTKCYTDMILALQSKGIAPILVSLPPLDAERYYQWITRNIVNKDDILKWLGSVQHIYRWHEHYSMAVSALARKYSCHFIDIRDAFLDAWDYEKYLCADGIHPNKSGHELMETAFCDYIEQYTS